MKALLTVGALLAALALVACQSHRAEAPKFRFDDRPYLGIDGISVRAARL
jgi:hypothetical protein